MARGATAQAMARMLEELEALKKLRAAALPEITEADEGKVLTVAGGKWVLRDPAETAPAKMTAARAASDKPAAARKAPARRAAAKSEK